MSACSCDVTLPDIYRESWPIARKQHECCECGSPIDKGEKYRLIDGKWEGEFKQFRQCEFCARVWNTVGMEYDECMAFSEMWELIGDQP